MQLDSDKIDEAVVDFKRALEVEQDIQCAKEGRDRAEKIRKQRGKRDYYAILGVSKCAFLSTVLFTLHSSLPASVALVALLCATPRE